MKVRVRKKLKRNISKLDGEETLSNNSEEFKLSQDSAQSNTSSTNH